MLILLLCLSFYSDHRNRIGFAVTLALFYESNIIFCLNGSEWQTLK